MDNEHITLATELLHEVKATSKRWFIAFCVMVIVEIATISGFLWYLSLPVENYDYTIQDMNEVSGNNTTQNVNVDK